MNLSGISIKKAIDAFEIKPYQCLIAHDYLDFDPGKTRLKKAGGNGLHNGLKSIDAEL